MSIYKRNKIYYISYTNEHGKRVQRSAKTSIKKEAEKLLITLKRDVWEIQKLGNKPKRSWKELCVMWCKDKENKKSLSDDLTKIRWLDNFFGNKNIDEISKQDIDEIIKIKKAEGCSNATVNRYLAFIKSALRIAKTEWEWIDEIPKIKFLKEDNERVRFLSNKEVNRLLSELPDHTRAMVIFSLATGLRKSNVTNLKWDQVDLNKKHAWVTASESKNNTSLPIPLNSDAIDVLNSQIGKHQTYVFTYKGNPVQSVNTKAWKNALSRAGIENFHWHDLRHTWASNHVKAGTPLYELQKLGGWKSISMVQRYAHLTSDHLQKHSANLPSFA